MFCKCKARTYEGHLRKVREGRASAHVYTGHHWGGDGQEELNAGHL